MYAENFIQLRIFSKSGNFRKSGRIWVFPRAVTQKRNQIQSHIVQHQCKQCFIGIKFRLEKCRNQPPQSAAQHTGQEHANHQQPVRKIPAKQSKIGGKNSPHNNLSFCTDIPEPHLKGQRYTKSRNQKRHHQLNSCLKGHSTSKCTGYNGSVYGKWIISDKEYEQSPCHNGKKNREQTQTDNLAMGSLTSLLNTNQGFFSAVFHYASSLLLPAIISPKSSLVVVLASTIPVASPWHITMILSEICRSTSKSSPINSTATPFFFCSLSRS